MSLSDVVVPGTDGWDRSQAASTLVRLMDDNGAYELLDPADSSRIARMWRKSEKGQIWSSADTIIAQPDGSWFARRTVLSRNTRSFTRAWNPLRLTLWVRRDGVIEAWSLSRGEAIPASGG
jgi:hypothetical protein